MIGEPFDVSFPDIAFRKKPDRCRTAEKDNLQPVEKGTFFWRQNQNLKPKLAIKQLIVQAADDSFCVL